MISRYIQKSFSVNVLIGVIVLSLVFAWTLQLVFKMEPCSLCLLQRFGLYISLSVLLVYVLINKWKQFKYINLSLMFMSLIGIGFSLLSGLRQTYIQMLPADEVPSCGADLNTLLQIVTPLEAVKKVFQGSGECAEKVFVFLGMSLANWATLLLLLLFVIQIIIIIKKIKNRGNGEIRTHVAN